MSEYEALKTRLRLDSELGQSAADAIEALERERDAALANNAAWIESARLEDNERAWSEVTRLQTLADERGERIEALERAAIPYYTGPAAKSG